jgi:hypothetical protein
MTKRDDQTIERILFVAALLTFGFFHAGGAWGPNTRLAMVRAMVEEGHLWIDSFLIYTRDGDDPARLRRVPVDNARVEVEGKVTALAWRLEDGRLAPVDGSSAGPDVLGVTDVAATGGDLSFAGGHFYPNKAPGTQLLAVPAYFAVFHLERLLGIDPDAHWPLTVNAWLTSALSVGLVAALGVALFYRVAGALGGSSSEALIATIAFAFGTIYFPHATFLMEHDVAATALLAAFYLLFRIRSGLTQAGALRAGLAVGAAVLVTHTLLPIVALLALYLASANAGRHPRVWLRFGAGLALPVVIGAAYDQIAFGSVWATSYQFENPLFQDHGKVLGLFGRPQLDVVALLLISPFRGLFVTSPVLLAGVGALMAWLAGTTRRAEALLFLTTGLFLVLVNSSFNGWHGGYTIGPRYLIPAVPFLALPILSAARRYRRTTIGLTAVSAALMLVATAVDPQPPIGIAPWAAVSGRATWSYSPMTEYELPLFLTSRAGPILARQLDDYTARYRAKLEAVHAPDIDQRVRVTRRQMEASIAAREPRPFLLASYEGPVSANPTGVYEPEPFVVFDPPSPTARWNAFNAGELFLPGRVSLLPLLLIAAAAVWALRKARPKA